MKKKLGIFLCVLLCAVPMMGCNSKTTPKETTSATASLSAEITPATDALPSQTPEATSTDSGETPSRGTWTDKEYENEYAGIAFTCPEGWNIGTDEEIASVIGVGSQIMAEEGMQFNEEMLEAQAIYDMMCASPVNGSSVAVMFENLGIVLGGSMMSEEQYFQSMISQFEALESLSYEVIGTSKTTLCGEEYALLELEETSMGYKQYYFARKQGKFMTVVLITVKGNDDVETLLKQFS